MGDHELTLHAVCRPDETKDGGVVGCVGGERVEGGTDQARRVPGRAALGPHEAGRRDRQFLGHPGQVGFRAGQDLLHGEFGVEHQAQLAGEQFGAKPWLAEAVAPAAGQPFLQPSGVRGQGVEGLRQYAGETGLAAIGPGGPPGEFPGEQALGPGKLGERRLDVDLGHGAEHRPGRSQRLRQHGEPPGDAAQPVRQGREVAGEQVVDRPAGVGGHRIPLVLTQLVDHEPKPGELVRQDLRVHLVLRGKAISVDGRQPGQPVTGPAAGLLVVCGGAHREPVVVTVIADGGGPLRLAFQQTVERRRGVGGKGAVHIVCHAPNLRLPPHHGLQHRQAAARPAGR